MIIKNSVSLTLNEAVELLKKITNSLEKNREFAFDLKGQEISIEVGPELLAQLSIKPEEFSMVFNWESKKQEPSEISKPPVETPTPPPQTKSQGIPIPKKKPQEKPAPSKPIKRKSSSPPRVLPKRAVLNTTTLPLDAGYWAPAFTENGGSQWTEVNIDEELENTKWASEEQLTTLSDLTPRQAKPKKSRTSRNVTNDDLFSELDEMDDKTSSRPKTRKQPTVTRKESPAPAALTNEIPKPTSSSDTQKEDTLSETKLEEEVTEEDWVKPSEVISKPSQKQMKSKSGTIPKPKDQISKPSPAGTQSDIPVPPAQSIPTPPAQSSPTSVEDQEQSADWEEPVSEDDDDDWIKPSEVLKAKDKLEKEENEVEEKIQRPPPKAPDSEDEEEKGWASWD